MMYALNRFASPEHTEVGGREAVSRDRLLRVNLGSSGVSKPTGRYRAVDPAQIGQKRAVGPTKLAP
jgi:hypothetical protein